MPTRSTLRALMVAAATLPAAVSPAQVNTYRWMGTFTLAPINTVGTPLPDPLPARGSFRLEYVVAASALDLNPGAFGQYEIRSASLTLSGTGLSTRRSALLPAVLFGVSLGSISITDLTLLPDSITGSSLWLGPIAPGYAPRSLLTFPATVGLPSPDSLVSDGQPTHPFSINLNGAFRELATLRINDDLSDPATLPDLQLSLDYNRFTFVPAPGVAAAFGITACAGLRRRR